MTRTVNVNAAFLDSLCEFLLEGEPVFVVRAQDKLIQDIITDYHRRAMAAGAKNLSRVQRKLDVIRKWQEENSNRVKLPD